MYEKICIIIKFCGAEKYLFSNYRVFTVPYANIYFVYNIIINVQCVGSLPHRICRHLFFCPRAENQEGGTRKIRQIYTFIETIHKVLWGVG